MKSIPDNIKTALNATSLEVEGCKVPAIYIAVIDNNAHATKVGGKTEPAHFFLEVEISSDSIGVTFDTKSDVLSYARQLADYLDSRIAALGIKVYKTRKEWEKYLEVFE